MNAWPLLVFLTAVSLQAQPYQGPLFDAHLHYNVEALGETPITQVLAKMKAAGVEAFLSNSRPNEGTKDLARTVLQGAPRIVPFVRLYRNRDDYQSWYRDPTIYDLVETELKAGTAAGPYRGLGEFHLYESQNANGETARRLMRVARERDLVVLAHVDADAVELLFAHAPGTKLIWAHTGIGGAPVTRVRALLEKYPTLYGELSYRPGLTGADGHLTPEWKALLSARSDRFFIGSDTWINPRWDDYLDIMSAYRLWLGDLTRDQAAAIAWVNGARLFGFSAGGP